MDFRFVPPSIVALSSTVLMVSIVTAMPAPQDAPAPAPVATRAGSGPQTRFLPGLSLPTTNPNQGLQNGLAGAGLGAVGGFALTNCLINNNCDLAFRPSIGASVDANGQLLPQVGITTQAGNGPLAPTFTSGLQFGSQSGIGGFVAGGVNNGDPNSVSPGLQTGFGFSQNSAGQLEATSQLGGNLQTPQLGGINFGRPNSGLPFGAQPTFLNQPVFQQQPRPNNFNNGGNIFAVPAPTVSSGPRRPLVRGGAPLTRAGPVVADAVVVEA